MKPRQDSQASNGQRLCECAGDRACSLCPCPQLTAYWTPPPTWPRRLLCESSNQMPCSRRGWLITAAMFLLYFLFMDIFLFVRYCRVNLVDEFKIGSPDELYSPFTHLTVKGMLNDHPSQFIIAPTTEYFDMITHFSSVFSFITPNMISIAHLICGFIACKFIASDSLQDRRIGVVLFEYRTWLDAFDGTVHRAQRGLHLKYHSDHSTMGYAIDSACDTLGGAFLCFGIFFYLLKRFGHCKTSLPNSYNGRESDLPTKGPLLISNGQSSHAKETFSCWNIFWKCFSVGLCLGITGKCWDQAVEDYTQVFQTNLQGPLVHSRQEAHSHSFLTLCIFYLWRVLGGQSTLNYILIAVYADKVWEFIRYYIQYVLMSAALILFIISEIHIHQIRTNLGM